jgi:hypothetical protein
MMIAWILALGLAATPLTATAQDASDAPALAPRPLPKVGRPYGELVLPTLDGSRTVSLDVYRGRKVLLIEFASW